MRARWPIALIVVALAGAVGWWWASPLWTLNSMRSAAEAGDAPALSEHIDFPALREDLKAELMAQMVMEAGRRPGEKAGLAFAGAFIGPMIEGLITPQMMGRAFAAQGDAPPGDRAGTGRAFDVGESPRIERIGLSEFRLVPRDAKSGGLVFRRSGLGWKLVGVDLPEE